MAVASEYGIEVGRTYESRKGSRSPARYVLWISADGRSVQYDGAAVRMGQRYPSVSADAFARWAGLARDHIRRGP